MTHVRIPRRAPNLRQTVSGSFAGPKMDDFSPYAAEVDAGFSMVRGMEAADYRRDGEALRREGFEANAIVNACARIIADQIATARLESYTVTANGEIALNPRDALQQLLDQPAPQWSGHRFRRTQALHFALYGNAYAHITRNANGTVSRLRVIHPERLQNIVVDEASSDILAYVWSRGDGRQAVSPWTDMIHTKDLLIDPDMYFGFPRALAALKQILTDTKASDYVRQILHNSGIPALVFFGRQGVGIESLKRAEEAWHEKMVEQGERGRTRFMGGVESLQVIGHSLKDLEFPSLRGITREDICAAFGVDPRMVGASSAKGQEGGLSGSQYQEARRRLEQQTCAPMRLEIQESLDISLTPEFGSVYARFSPSAIAAIIETPTEIAQRSAVMVASRIVTIEEARAENGLPEQMDAQHTTEAAMLQTIEEALAANERAEEAAAVDAAAKTAGAVAKGATVSEQVDGPNGITDANNNTERQASAPAPDARTAVASRVRTGGAPDLSTEEEDAAWAVFDERARALEPMIEEMASEAYEEAVRSVIRLMEIAADGGVVRSESDPWWDRFLGALPGVFGVTGAVRRMIERLFMRRMSVMMERAAQEMAEELALPFNTDTPTFRAGIRVRLETLARSMGDTIARRISEITTLARAANISAPELAAALRALDWKGLAKRVAATESVGLLNHAEMMVASEAPTVRKKRWLSQRDLRVRESHIRCDGAGWIDMGSAFPNGLRYAHDPNGSSDEVTNCRCTTMYSDREGTP